MKPNVTAELIKVTPETASEWLQDRWGEQRTVRQGHVARLIQDMDSGHFKISPDAILRIKGKLANGQHRLEALVRHGKPQTFLVMESNDENLYKVIDAGLKRSVGDGLIGVLHSQRLNGVAGWVRAYDNGSVMPSSNSGADAAAKYKGTKKSRVQLYATQTEMIDYCIANKDALVEAVSFVAPLYKNQPILSMSIGAALYVIGSRRHPKETQDFLQKTYLDGGANAAGDFKNRLTANKISKAKLNPGYVFGLGIKSLRSFLKGTRLGSLKLSRDESFPTLD